MILKRKPGIFVVPFLLLAAGSIGAQDTSVENEAPGPNDTIVPVAEQDLEADTAAGPTIAGDEEQLATEFARFKELISEGALDEADSVAKRVIELAISTKGPESTEMAKALTNLAIVQHRNEQYDAALQNYQTAIEIIETSEDRLNAQLVNPLRGLAAAQLNTGRPDLATVTYGRAVHITHVNEGPHTLDQIGLLENLAEAKVRMGDVESARGIQETIYALNVRHFRSDAMALVPALMRRAKWQHRLGFIYDERATYRRVIRIVEDRSGKDSINLVEPLMLLGTSYFFHDMTAETSLRDPSMSAGEIYFKRALKIAAESPDSNWQLVATATVSLGDFYMYQGNPQRAKAVYGGAWSLLSESGDHSEKLAFRHRELESAVSLREQRLPPFVGESDPTVPTTTEDPVLQGSVTMSYTVTTRGKAAELKLIEAVPPEFTNMQKSVHREIRRRIYRPRFLDAEPVEAPDQVLVHTFFYRQSDLDAARKAAATEAGES